MITWIVLLGLLQQCRSLSVTVPLVLTSYGYTEGTWRTSATERTYAAFTGIPYAKPPVGPLRFANPERPDGWTDVYNATYYRPRCIQQNSIFSQHPPIEGSEDCLYLNVYVPAQDVEVTIDQLQLPVMVAIHWGGFFAGGSDDGYLGPEYFMDHDVILVTFNYRLGVFGFLSTLDDASPGNYGLKDQILALKWVQENIRFFGGVPENVTIFGQSAGAASVHLHYISEASDGLFSKGISQSGTALAVWATPNNDQQLMVTNIQAQLVNCTSPSGNSTEMVNCLREIPANVLLGTQDSFKIFHRFPFAAWSLVLEKETDKNPEPFMTQFSYDALESGEFKRLPWLVGSVSNEGLLIAASLLTVQSEIQDLNKDFNVTMLNLLGIPSESDPSYQMIFDHYLDDKNSLDVNNSGFVQHFVDTFSDRYFLRSLYDSLKLQVNNGHDSIYLYSFEYSGEYTYAKLFSTEPLSYNLTLGPAHCDDLIYQYSSPELFGELKEVKDMELVRIWLGLWTNFAKYGNPNPEEKVILPHIDWQPLIPTDGSLANSDITLLNVTGSYQTGASFNITSGFYSERMSFWDNISRMT